MAGVVLAKGKDRRIKAGHLWVYRGEIASVDEGVAAGDMVEVRDFRRRLLGRGSYNPASTLSVRLFTREPQEAVDRILLEKRIAEALAFRDRIFPGETTLRLVFSEGDFLPGLVVDRYGDYLCVQLGTLGMERFRPALLEILDQQIHPRGIYERSDLSSRSHEGLSPAEGILAGEVPPAIDLEIDGIRFRVRVREGQKTGLFLDQRLNWREALALAAGKRVLDVFCNTGAFALYALKGGAASALGVDISEASLGQAREQAGLNGFAARSEFRAANAFDFLHERDRASERYDLVVLDPPAFTKSASSVPQAWRGYKEINLRALRILSPGGFLLTSSCSYHLSAEDFLAILREAVSDSGRRVRLLALRGQSPDHPVVPGVPETRYLKFALLHGS
jgi:23S rRNA (cytosine1962-C5)-methyltransferase